MALDRRHSTSIKGPRDDIWEVAHTLDVERIDSVLRSCSMPVVRLFELDRRHHRAHKHQVPTEDEPGIFATTRWSVVLAAGDHRSPDSQDALERLCRAYWLPLYAYVRAKSFNPADAEDLTQEFFARFLATDALGQVQKERGRFRAYLLACLNHFLANAWDKSQAQKRGAGKQIISFDALSAEERLRIEPAAADSPEQAFDQRWAITLLDSALDRLRIEMVRAGKTNIFEALRAHLSTTGQPKAYAELAGNFGVTEAAVRKMVQRFRNRYGELLREEVAHTVDSPREVEAELRTLLHVFARR